MRYIRKFSGHATYVARMVDISFVAFAVHIKETEHNDSAS
jgi:hypothetical protein